MMENWKKWEPIKDLSNKYYIEYVFDSIDGFKILLFSADNRNEKVSVLFRDSVDAYRSVDESFRLKLIKQLGEKYGDNFYGQWTFFKVNDSDYVKWLSNESYGISDSLEFKHFSFIAADSILDIVTTYEPKVEIYTQK